jgi:RNA polymerase sigma factor (sigma-70 family)
MRSGPESPADAAVSASKSQSPLLQINDTAPTPCARAESLNRVWPYVPMLRDFVARRVSANDVEDIVQESLVRVWRRDGDTPIAHPKSYLIRIANAVMIDRARREGTRRTKMHCGLEERHHPKDPLSPHRIVLGREQFTIFMRAFEQLPSRTRDILVAIRMDGESFKAVAQRFGISVSAVEKVIASALRVLSEYLKEAERAQRLADVSKRTTARPSARRQLADERASAQ